MQDLSHVACVQIVNHQRLYSIDHDKISTIASTICGRLGVDHYEVCIRFVSQRTMKNLNTKFRDKNKSTDVLSFPQYTWKRALKVRRTAPVVRPVLNPMPLGDVVISLEDAASNALESKHPLARELCFLIVHGILHLVGHDHMVKREKKLMFGEQSKLMRTLTKGPKAQPAWARCVTRKPSRKVRS